MNNSIYKKMHRFYPVSKTLRFELKPIGKTRENIEKEKLIETDEKRHKDFKKVKKYCDEVHKDFIEKTLKNVNLENLDKYYKLFNVENRNDEQKKEFSELQESLRKEIADAFKNAKYSELLKADMIKKHLKEMYKNDIEKSSEIQQFEKFTTYFVGYNTNRENMYSGEEKSTAISYRLINENLPTFIKNMKIYKKIKDSIPEDLNNLYKELEAYMQVNNIDEMFELDYYNDVLTQKGIEVYNLVISGKSEDDNKKIQGINEYINLYNQKNKTKLPKLTELYKQILSDREKTSFLFDVLENDEILVTEIEDYIKEFEQHIDGFKNLIEHITDYDINKIYLNNDKTITDISQALYGEYGIITKKIEEKYDLEYTGKTKRDSEKYLEERKKSLKSEKVFSIGYIQDLIEGEKDLCEYFKNYLTDKKIPVLDEKGKAKLDDKGNSIEISILEAINNDITEFSSIKNKYLTDKKELIKSDSDIEKIKDLLDSLKYIQEFAKILIPKDNTVDMDALFYNELREHYSVFGKLIALYNKTRNYLTQKPFSKEKFKINFNCPTFLNGWDINKEKNNLGVILLKDNKYYLGVMNPYCKKSFEKICENSIQSKNYRKMEYKLFPGPNKMLPKISLKAKNYRESHYVPQELMDKYDAGFHKKGEYFDIDFCRELIDFFKKVIKEDEYWGKQNIEFSDTSTYNDISEFYREVEERLYTINYKNYDEDYINELVDRGDLYLFEIYNKDFSEYSKGRKNLHTLYWEAVFDERNLANVVYKLNGEAEVFFREKSLERKITHRKNEAIKNKNPDNPKKTSIFNYDLIKNKRYTEDKFLFHVPITLNFKNQKLNNINEFVNRELKNSDDVHVIGIDRGERNLIYICVIDKNGKIVKGGQIPLNQIINEYNGTKLKTDYHKLLDKKEKERDEARKSWKTIDNIKELKEGYISQVVHVIVELMRKYNAIVVLEDLNFGFKNSRIKVEKQVYQKFEKMLIDKLNYLVFKDEQWCDDGGVLNAYQLTNKFESFKKMGKQSGVLFYIPAWNTSKIDPTTGFVNLFYVKYESVDKTKEFIRKFADIRFNENEDYFEFVVDDYSKFTDRLNNSKKDWIICTYKDRIETFRNPEKNNQWDNRVIKLSDEFKKLFEQYNVDLNNIKESILEKNDTKLFIEFMRLFKLTVQMRNSITNGEEDYLISPVKNKYNEFFDTREGDERLPLDADANGAYNIARKGLMLIEQIKKTADDKLGKIKYDISNKEWLSYAQNKDNLEWKK